MNQQTQSIEPTISSVTEPIPLNKETGTFFIDSSYRFFGWTGDEEFSRRCWNFAFNHEIIQTISQIHRYDSAGPLQGIEKGEVTRVVDIVSSLKSFIEAKNEAGIKMEYDYSKGVVEQAGLDTEISISCREKWLKDRLFQYFMGETYLFDSDKLDILEIWNEVEIFDEETGEKLGVDKAIADISMNKEIMHECAMIRLNDFFTSCLKTTTSEIIIEKNRRANRRNNILFVED